MKLSRSILGSTRNPLTRAILALGLIMGVAVPDSGAAVITFDNVISSQTSYAFDGDGDSVNDVIFSTTDPGGFNTIGPGTNMNYIQEPGVEGTAMLIEDLRVSFLNGAVGSLSFGFALSSGAEGPDVFAKFSVYDASDALIATSTVYGLFTATPSGNSSFPEGQVNVNFSGLASYATFDFSSGGRYIIDNFSGTFGSTEASAIAAGQVPEPSTAIMLLIGGAIVGVVRRRVA
jgi:hypothetical protein